ncbi:arginine deiminase family protein [Glycocaulis sp.]
MTFISRRAALGLTGGAALSLVLPQVACARQERSPRNSDGPAFVRNDIGRLREVLIHTSTERDYQIDRLRRGLVPYLDLDWEVASRQQQAFAQLLRDAGANALEIEDVLASAIEVAKSDGSWRAWLSAAHPRLSLDPDAVTADTLLGRDPAYQFQRRGDGSYSHFASGTTSTMWTRDASFMTPGGLVICNSASEGRLRENMTLRFIAMHAPELADYPVAFDAVAEGLIVEGGDAQMVDRNTLFLGVGQRSDPRTAPELARRLNLDVVAVQIHKTDFLTRAPGLAGGGAVGQLRVLFLHLDTFFTHVNHEHVLAVPWFLEMEHSGEDPLSQFIRGARADTAIEASDAEAGLNFLKEFGKVTVYRAGTGQKEDMEEMKLLDYVKARGYRVTYVGGREPEDSAEAFSHFMNVSLGELRRQASNVVATAPGEVLAYAGSPRTRAALERDDIGVTSFDARELWAHHGGPHCLTMPLRRD